MGEDRDPIEIDAGRPPGGEGMTRRRGWRWRHWIAALLMVLGLTVAGALIWLDSPSGHRFVTRQVASLAPRSGLRIEIGRIDGSLYNKAVLHDVRLSDPRGLFFSAGKVRLEWWPVAWLSNRLEIDALLVPEAHLYRLPRLKPTEPKGKILPDFDIRIMRLQVDRLYVHRAVTGRADIFALQGDADIRSGHAVVDLSARALRGKDRLLLSLDSRPDDNRFDVDLTINAPAGGLLATLSGLKQDANLRLEGAGDWRRWDGRFIGTLAGKSAAGFAIRQQRGNFRIEGTISGPAIAERGLLARLASPELAVRAEGRYQDRLVAGHVLARSDAISVDMKGGVHLGGRGYDNLLVDVAARRPSALLRNFDARGLMGRLRLNGPFAAARFEYLFQADRLSFGRTILHGVRAAGHGQAAGGNAAMVIPLELSARRIDGQGDIITSVLTNVSITGVLQKKGDIITSSPLRLRSDKLAGELVALFDLKSGRYDLALGGTIKGLLIPGLGIVDLESRLRAAPDARGAFGVTGRAAASMRRLDNSFLRTLGGGLPQIRSDIALGADGRLRLTGLTVRAPLLSLNGEGIRNPDGTVRLSGRGRHARYGPVRLVLTGRLERPAVDLVLERPADAAGLADVHVLLDPDPAGYRFRAAGQSTLGPFEGDGMIELPRGGQAAIDVQRLRLNGSEGQGRLLVVDGGLSGRLIVSGAARGTIDLAVVSGVQKADASLRIAQARFAGPVLIDLARGRLTAQLSFDPGGTSIDATLTGRGLRVGGFRINRIAANARLVNGEGKLRASVTGQQGQPFNMQLDADIANDEIRFDLGGTLDQQPISFDRRARLARIEGGWALDPLTLRYRGGGARINAASFGAATRLDLDLQRLPLSLLDLSNVDLGLSGVASGRLAYAQERGHMPTGKASLTIRGLSRSGATRTSTPVDMGVNAELTGSRLALRSVMSQKGKVIGRAQALMSPLGGGTLIERLRGAPVRAQIRYVGPAEAVWRMSRIEIVDLRGEIAVKADIGGTGANPLINGALLTRAASLESPVTGMSLTGIKSRARFDGSRLVFSEMSGTTENGGTVTGGGSFDFSLGQGIGIDLRFRAANAELLDRDDIGAIVNGPVTIQSDGNGGIIGGDFDVVRSRFTLGRAAAVAQIPELRVIEKNGRPDDFEPVRRGAAWRLAIKANARNRLMVSGMGLSSEWRMNIDIGGTVDQPRIVGTADLVRGSYDFAGRRFDLKEGSLRFDGSVPANPRLDITAEATVSDLDATIRITGTSAVPEISFSSIPALPQDEVLSRILFGSSITQLSAPEALQLASAVASLRGSGGGLDPINAVRKAAGLDRLRILPSDPATGQATSIGAGKYLTRKIYVELITDGQGYSATRMEYQVTRWLALLASISTLGRESVAVRVSKDY